MWEIPTSLCKQWPPERPAFLYWCIYKRWSIVVCRATRILWDNTRSCEMINEMILSVEINLSWLRVVLRMRVCCGMSSPYISTVNSAKPILCRCFYLRNSYPSVGGLSRHLLAMWFALAVSWNGSVKHRTEVWRATTLQIRNHKKYRSGVNGHNSRSTMNIENNNNMSRIFRFSRI